MKFRVAHKPGVAEQIRGLHQLAKAASQEVEYVRALKQIVQLLESHPLEWGDPEYHPIHEGSTICHGVLDPVFVRYAVYEIEETVYILHVQFAGKVPKD